MKKQKIKKHYSFDMDNTQVVSHYESPKGVISLRPPYWVGMGNYEIWCVKGNLFEGTEYYSSFQKAEARIRELLEV